MNSPFVSGNTKTLDSDLSMSDDIVLTPAFQLYKPLHQSYQYFNEHLFNNMLTGECMITLQKRGRSVGYFGAEQYQKVDGNYTVDVIALNPTCFLHKEPAEVLSTLAHEMAHQWQHHFGKPSRNGYHNKQWVAKMAEIGLIASNTGKPGGKQTGQQMTHYIEAGGRFDIVCRQLLDTGLVIPWGEITDADKPPSPPNPKYVCPICELKISVKRTHNEVVMACGCSGEWVPMTQAVIKADRGL